MRALGKGVWGQVADKLFEACVAFGTVLAIFVRNRFDWRAIRDSQWESIAIGVSAVSLLVFWHSFRSAYAVSAEIRNEQREYGFSSQPLRISFPVPKLYGIALCLTLLASLASIFMWKLSNQKEGVELLRRAERTVSDFQGFMDASAERQANVLRLIRQRNSQKRSDGSLVWSLQSQQDFGKWQYDQFVEGELSVYRQTYKDELLKLRRDLSAKVPEAVITSTQYDATKLTDLVGIRAELEFMLMAYKSKLKTERKI